MGAAGTGRGDGCPRCWHGGIGGRHDGEDAAEWVHVLGRAIRGALLIYLLTCENDCQKAAVRSREAPWSVLLAARAHELVVAVDE